MHSFLISAQKVREMEDVVNQCSENVGPFNCNFPLMVSIDHSPSAGGRHEKICDQPDGNGHDLACSEYDEMEF